MARYNGVDLGIVESMQTSAAPKERQLNGYPGVDGLENLDMGSRGGKTTARGALAGTSFGDLAAIQQVFINLQSDGGSYNLLDNKGTLWTNVILLYFQIVGRMYLLPNGVAQRYEVEFLHTGN